MHLIIPKENRNFFGGGFPEQQSKENGNDDRLAVAFLTKLPQCEGFSKIGLN